MNNRILITGANGFVGRALTAHLVSRQLPVRPALRRAAASDVDCVSVGDIGAQTDWREALEEVDCVVHLAAHAHRMREVDDDARLYRKVNVEGAQQLARQSLEAGVSRFIFLSTAKVYGESSGEGAFREQDRPHPQDDYARSKLEAEQALRAVFASSATRLTILRPPLIYGPGVGANFLRLMEHVAQQRLLPLGGVRNKRSMIGMGNLVNAIEACIVNSGAADRTFNVSDGEDMSTPELIRRLANALGVRANLPELPMGMLRFGAQVAGQAAMADRLLGNFVVDSSLIRAALPWNSDPIDEELAATVRWYRESANPQRGGRA